MRIASIHLLSILCIAGCASNTPPPPAPPAALPSVTSLPAPRLEASDQPVLVIYRDGYQLTPEQQSLRPRVECAVWSDGRIVWQAGGKLQQGQMNPARLDELLQRLHQEGVFGDGDTYFGAFGPDAVFTVIEIRLADRHFKLASWHERFADNPKLIVTSHGVESLQGRDPAEIAAIDDPEYVRFRRIWAEIRSAQKSWIPERGEPFEGEVRLGG